MFAPYAPPLDVNFWELVKSSDPVTVGVMGILGLASILSWTIILSKLFAFSKARSSNRKFLRAFRKAPRLDDPPPLFLQRLSYGIIGAGGCPEFLEQRRLSLCRCGLALAKIGIVAHSSCSINSVCHREHPGVGSLEIRLIP